MARSITWKLRANLQEKIIALASQRGLSPETIITEAVSQYLETSNINKKVDDDPLIGLFASSSESLVNHYAKFY